MQSAFSKFGQAFTDTGDVKKDAATRDSRLAPYIEAGGQASKALENRWHQMEYENIKNEKIEPWVAQKKAMLDDYQRRSAQGDIGIFEGPNGEPIELDVRNNAEDRLLAQRMTNQLTKRFYALNGDMDMELFNEMGKYSNNPLITDRALAIQAATSEQLMTIANPEDSINAEDKMSIMRQREADSAAKMVQAKNVGAQGKEKRAISYDDAMADPTIGAGGIMRWLISDPNGVAILTTGGGSAFLDAEKKLAKGGLMKDNPSYTEGSAELEDALDRLKPQWMSAAAAKYVKHLSPSDYEMAKQITPHFFAADAEAKEVGIKDGDRVAPSTRKANLKTWENHAEDHFRKYMRDGTNDTSIEAAMEDLEQWIGAAVYGETEEPQLLAVSATRSEGNRRYVSEIVEGVIKHVENWWMTPDKVDEAGKQIGGSGIAIEENPRQAGLLRAAKKPGKKGQYARGELRRQRRKKDKGILP
jgi:hypothetical protein